MRDSVWNSSSSGSPSTTTTQIINLQASKGPIFIWFFPQKLFGAELNTTNISSCCISTPEQSAWWILPLLWGMKDTEWQPSSAMVKKLLGWGLISTLSTHLGMSKWAAKITKKFLCAGLLSAFQKISHQWTEGEFNQGLHLHWPVILRGIPFLVIICERELTSFGVCCNLPSQRKTPVDEA